MTYNQIITLLQNIASANYFIKSFGHGEAWEINSDDDFNDYVLWVIPIDSTTEINVKRRRFTILVFKQVKKDKSDETLILSDCEQILDDVIKVFRTQSNDYDLSEIPVLNPFKEEFHDWCAGWRADLVIETEFANNGCDMPMDSVVTPTPGNNASYVRDIANGNIIVTLYPGQSYSVEILQEIIDTITNNTATVIDPIT